MNKRLRVLIVEDEALLAMQLEDELIEAGHVVGSAMNSREALRLAAETRPDLALVDIHLADGPTGVEVARAIASSGTAVVFTTANDKRIPADFAGAAGVIPGPIRRAASCGRWSSCAGRLDGGTALPPPLSLQLAPRLGEAGNGGFRLLPSH